MFASNQIHYIPGEKPEKDTPLDRYLPPFHRHVVSKWLADNISPGGWVIDPFGTSPELICEAAARGYKVLVSINNPIIRFILELQCTPIQETDFQAAIAFLASSQVGGERLEPHIKSLYETLCDGCGRAIQVEAFIWKRGATVPSGRIYSCPYCGDAGEHPVSQFDIEKASRFFKHGLHRARALERVTPLYDPDRHHVEEAIEVYLPRAIYALITLINKLVSIPENDPTYRLISALLLLAFDRANTLWSYPKGRQRPKQLTVPPQFLEHNIWLALEIAAKIWLHDGNMIPITKWPQEPPPEGGICVYEGRIRSLVTDLTKITGSAVVSSFPRPNQAFWTLSALWSGWLWGHEALEHFKSVLRRRRYDWSWHINAIKSALDYLVPSLSADTPYFGLINELEPGFLSAVLLGSQLSKLNLTGIAVRAEEGQAQITWEAEKEDSKGVNETSEIKDEIITSTRSYIIERGEPCEYLYLHAAGLAGLVNQPRLSNNFTPGDYLSQVHTAFQDNLNYRNGFLRYAGSEKSLDVGLWWLKDVEGQILPLSDRVEIALINYLRKNPEHTLSEIDAAICNSTPGLSPPDTNFIYECLQSYGVTNTPDSNQWELSAKEHEDIRGKDLIEISQSLMMLGERLGCRVRKLEAEISAILWVKDKGQEELIFYLSTSAVLGKYLSLSIPSHQKSYIIIPGSRSNLVAFKLERNPHLNQIFRQNWKFIKYRLIRQLVNKVNISFGNIEEQFTLDPITYTTPQIRMF